MRASIQKLAETSTRVALTLVLVLGLSDGRGALAEGSLPACRGDMSSLTLEELMDLAVRPWEALEAKRSLSMSGCVARCAGAADLGDMLELMGLDLVPLPLGRTLLVAPRPAEVDVKSLTLGGRRLGPAGVLRTSELGRPAERVLGVQLLLTPDAGPRQGLVIHVTLAGGEGEG